MNALLHVSCTFNSLCLIPLTSCNLCNVMHAGGGAWGGWQMLRDHVIIGTIDHIQESY